MVDRNVREPLGKYGLHSNQHVCMHGGMAFVLVKQTMHKALHVLNELSDKDNDNHLCIGVALVNHPSCHR